VLIDRFNRAVTHLRISITNRCNHRCVFCHSEGYFEKKPVEELTAEHWGFVASVAASIGVKYVKITGGEPLVRRDIVEVVEYMVENRLETSMVTNGSLLENYADKLAEKGLSYVNVSLHSLNREKFKMITGGDLERVLRGIDAAVNAGLKTRLDYVVLAWNIDEYRDIVDYASRKGLDLNIIELIPVGLAITEWRELHRSLSEIESYLEEISVAKRVREFQSRPVYVLPSGIEVTLVKGFCNPEMCIACTRLRMTPEGYIKTCIYRNDQLVDARKYILAFDREGLAAAFKKAVEIREPFFKPGEKLSLEDIVAKAKLYEVGFAW